MSNHPLSATALSLALGVFILSQPVHADERYAPIKNPLVLKECAECHMAFSPQMLPAKSWNALMANLSNHFGEDASLDDQTRDAIKSYLVKNAADASWLGGRFMRGLNKTSTPLRITETPYWIRQHKEDVPDRAWRDPKVKSKANCVACHPRAQQGFYGTDGGVFKDD